MLFFDDINFVEIYNMYPVLFFIYVFTIGLIIGSFLNVVILRLPIIEGLVEDSANKLPKTLMGRSHCPCCGDQLPWYVNVPVFSWLILRGKAKCCGSKIHWRYPFVELTTALFMSLMLLTFGPTAKMFFGLVLGCQLICLAVVDFEHMLLPDKLTYGVLWTSLLSSVWSVFLGPESAIIGAIIGFLFVGLINEVFKWISGKSGIGGGDYKLAAGLGSIAGSMAVPGIVGAAFLLFACYGLACRFNGRAGQLPLGPFLILGFLVWQIWGPFYIC